MKKFQYILAYFLIGCAYLSSAQTTTAVNFLRIFPDAKASGMGSTGIATQPGAEALSFNAAKIPFSKEKGAITANYSPWLKQWSNDMYLASIGGYYRLNDNEAVHGQARYFNPGDIEFTDANGNHLQAYHPYEMAVDVGYSRKLSRQMGLGLTVRYIRSDLARGTFNGESFKPANAVAGDLGWYYDLKNTAEEGWSFGAQLSNIGTKISYSGNATTKSSLPMNIGAGAAYSKLFDEQNKITWAADINTMLAPGNKFKEYQLSAGADYWYDGLFGVRTGYFYETNRGRKYFSAGAGIRYSAITANFAYLMAGSQNKNPLANTLLFGLTVNFK